MIYNALALLLAISQAEPELAQLDDEQFCEVVRYAVGQSGTPGKPGRPVFSRSVRVACNEKPVTVEYQLTTRDRAFRRWVRAYMLEIEPNACSDEGLMVAFRERGWQQHYSFRSGNRRTIEHTIAC